jgi:YYY domain-containing protein
VTRTPSLSSNVEPTVRRAGLWLGAILVLALVCRLVDVNWDGGHAFHPDERALAAAIERLSFQPLQLNPKFFAYGSLPIYATKLAATAVGRFIQRPLVYTELLLIGRLLSALAGALTVLLLYGLARRLYDRETGLLAAALLATCVLHLQHSHFMTTDVWLTLLVLASLGAVIAAVRSGRAADFVLAGTLAGLAVAAKLSALPLMLPVATAALLASGDRRWIRRARNFVAAAAAAFVAFSVAEPYAWLDFALFLDQVREQGRIVANAGSLPYTIQYMGTWKYGYELSQLLLWGMGPALGLVALWATSVRTRNLFRAWSNESAVLLAWVLPYFLITGWFEVKFPRYLLPIYPLLILWAAAWLMELYRRGGWRRVMVTTLLVTHALVFAAFLRIYGGEHTVVRASDWVYRHAPEGARILLPHWEEGFPLRTPRGSPDDYERHEVRLYDPDSPEKIQRLTEELAGADYLVFPTKRLYGAISRVPERYPRTSALLSQLFAGQLGYRLVRAEASRPGLFGLTVPDELADESFSVYDHPKVVVFANQTGLSADEIMARVEGMGPLAGASRKQMLLAEPRSGPRVAGKVRETWLALGLFAATIALLAWAARTILGALLGPKGARRDVLQGLSFTLGPLLLAYLAWVTASWGVMAFSRGTLLGILVLLLIAATLIGYRGSLASPAVAPGKGVLSAQALFWGVFAILVWIRGLNPAIFWGEKPMDFAFLNLLDRTQGLPPGEPWFAGSTLQYTYFGHFLVAALGKLLHLEPSVTFNLGIAWVGAAAAASAFALGTAISRRRRVGLAAAVLTVFAGNLAGLPELLSRRSLSFDYFWGTSRVIEGAITEYPLWSLLFADLHSHLLVLPFSLSLLALLVCALRREPQERSFGSGHLVLMGLLLGAVATTNGWSTPVYLVFLPVALTWHELARGSTGRWWLERAARVVGRTMAVIAVAVLLFLPFWLHYWGPERRWGWEAVSALSLADYAQIFGLFLWIAVPFLLPRRDPLEPRGRAVRWLAALTLAVALALSLLSLPAIGAGFRSLRWALLLLALLALLMSFRERQSAPRAIALLFFAYACLLTTICDFVFVWDRMNTIFKYFFEAWLFFATSTSVLLFAVTERLSRRWRRAWWTGFAPLVVSMLLTTTTVLWVASTFQRLPTDSWSLDGLAYLTQRNPRERAAIDWLNEAVPGTPVLVEAWGPPYREYGRISMNTGLPIPVGWEYHVEQRGQSPAVIEQRKRDIEKIYRAETPEQLRVLLDRYRVSLMYVGALERRTYPQQDPSRFADWTDLLTLAYQNEDEAVYGVRHRVPIPSSVEEPSPLHRESIAESHLPGAELRQPRSVSVSSDGRIFVADFGNHRIVEFDPSLKMVASWGGPGDVWGRFREPCDLAIDNQGRVLVADTWNHRIQILSDQGEPIVTWPEDPRQQLFFGPRGVAIAGDGTVLVADTGNHRVVRLGPGGRLIDILGEEGSGTGALSEPTGIEVDAEGRMIVSDHGNGRLLILDPDGGVLSSFPVDGWRREVYSEPKAAVTSDGRVWLTVPLEGVVRAYDQEGTVVEERFEGWTAAGELAEFRHPLGVAYWADRAQLLVTDLERGLMRVPLAREDRK